MKAEYPPMRRTGRKETARNVTRSFLLTLSRAMDMSAAVLSCKNTTQYFAAAAVYITVATLISLVFQLNTTPF